MFFTERIADWDRVGAMPLIKGKGVIENRDRKGGFDREASFLKRLLQRTVLSFRLASGWRAFRSGAYSNMKPSF